jgi:hypothetical protein
MRTDICTLCTHSTRQAFYIRITSSTHMRIALQAHRTLTWRAFVLAASNTPADGPSSDARPPPNTAPTEAAECCAAEEAAKGRGREKAVGKSR